MRELLSAKVDGKDWMHVVCGARNSTGRRESWKSKLNE
jgi:hypothetical protein